MRTRSERAWIDALGTGALLLAALSAACSNENRPSPEPARDAGSDSAVDSAASQDGDAATFHGVILGRLANSLCLGFALPTNAAGDLASCRIVLDGEMSGCGRPGLLPAGAADVAAIDAYRRAHGQTALPGSMCEVVQLPAGTNCTDQSTPGWCYVHSACTADSGTSCDQDICTSAGFITENVSYGAVWLVCP